MHVASRELSAPASGDTRARQLDDATRDVRKHVTRLQALTHGLVWRTGGLLPGIGSSLSTVAALTAVGDELARDVLPPASAAAGDLLRGPRSGPLDLRPLTQRSDELGAALTTVRRSQSRVGGLDERVPVAQWASSRLTPRLQQAEQVLEQAHQLAVLGGGLSGQERPRRYLVVLQSPAESRATGGLVGGFVELEVRHGGVRVLREGTKHQLPDAAGRLPRIGGGFDETWGPYGVLDRWASSNLSLHFPAVARLWRARYDRTYGGRLDGVVALTPQALSGLLLLTGPVDLGRGYPVHAGDLPRLLERDIYEQFPRNADEPARDAEQLRILRRLVGAALRPIDLGPAVLDAARTVAAGGVRLESAHPREQAWFAGTSVGGALPSGPGPFVAWTTQSAGGSKLDPYLHRTVTYRRSPAVGQRQRVHASLHLRNAAPRKGLPEYVTISPKRQVVPGTSQLLVATYLSAGAQVRAVTVDGKAVTPRRGHEQGHPVVLVRVEIAPGGGTRRVDVLADEPASDAPVRTVRQPTSVPDVVRTLP